MNCDDIVAKIRARFTNLKIAPTKDNLIVFCDVDADEGAVTDAIEQLFNMVFRQGFTRVSDFRVTSEGSRVRIRVLGRE